MLLWVRTERPRYYFVKAAGFQTEALPGQKVIHFGQHFR